MRRRSDKARRPEVVSLFSGAGGLDAGLERAGWHTVTATDSDGDCVKTLNASQAETIPISGDWGHTYLAGAKIFRADVREVSAKDLRPKGASSDWRPALVAGGPPCQPWSSAGHQKGLRDPRGQLIAHFLRLVDELSPDFLIFENVRGLVTALGPSGQPGEVLKSIQMSLNEIGYASRISTLNAADYGAAQRRVRLMLLATARHQLPEFPLPTHSRDGSTEQLKPWVTLGELLATLPRPEEADVVHPAGARTEELLALTPGTGLRTGGRVENNRPSGHWGYRQDSFFADPSLPSRTIRAASTPDWVHVDDYGMRRLTWRECAALQGFPTEWAFQGSKPSKFRQIGNAVQGHVAEAIGHAVIQSWRNGHASEPPVTPPWPAELVKRAKYTEMEHRVNGEHRVRVRAAEAAAG